ARVLPAKIHSTLVAFDRTFCDMLVDPKRYRLAPARPLIRFLNALLPQPDLTFVLDADPQAIHARKPELPVEEITRQNAALRALAAGGSRNVLVPAGDAPRAVAGRVARETICFLARRLDQRPR